MDAPLASTPLPEPLAGPLHIVPPWLPSFLFWLAVAVLLAALVGLWWWRKWRKRNEQLPPLPEPSPGSLPQGLAERIKELSRRFVKLGKPREGCHELARELRSHIESRTGLQVEEMTVDEMKRRFGSRQIQQFWIELREHQFGRRKPRGNDLQRMSKHAVKLFAKRRNFDIRDGD